MADISKCDGKDCPLKHNCFRYLAPDNQWRQSYILAQHKDGECKNFLEKR